MSPCGNRELPWGRPASSSLGAHARESQPALALPPGCPPPRPPAECPPSAHRCGHDQRGGVGKPTAHTLLQDSLPSCSPSGARLHPNAGREGWSQLTSRGRSCPKTPGSSQLARVRTGNPGSLWRRKGGSHFAEPHRVGAPQGLPPWALGIGTHQHWPGRGRAGGTARAWGLPRRTHRGGAGATITGKAKAVVSLLGKYLWKPQEAAGGRAGPSAAPRHPGPRCARRGAAHLGRARPLHPARLCFPYYRLHTKSPSASLLDGPLRPSRV